MRSALPAATMALLVLGALVPAAPAQAAPPAPVFAGATWAEEYLPRVGQVSLGSACAGPIRLRLQQLPFGAAFEADAALAIAGLGGPAPACLFRGGAPGGATFTVTNPQGTIDLTGWYAAGPSGSAAYFRGVARGIQVDMLAAGP